MTNTNHITIPFGHFANVVWDIDADAIVWGVYEGTSIPQRRVPANAVLTIEQDSHGYRITDRDGGWIAERCGHIRIGQDFYIGRRDAVALGVA